MKKSALLLVSLFLILTFLTPINYRSQGVEIKTIPFQECGDGSVPSDPLNITADVYYGDNWSAFFSTYDERYMKIWLVENEIYFFFLDSPFSFWLIELYDDPLYTKLLGLPYSVYGASIWRHYMTFSPNRTGYYYPILYKMSADTTPNFNVMSAEPFSVNVSRIVIISEPSHPIHIFQMDLLEGNYSCSYETLYATIDRGWNYVVMADSYDFFPEEEVVYLPNCSVTVIIEDACIFELTYYPIQNETPEDPPPEDDNVTDGTRDPGVGDFFSGMTPLFGVGVLVGIVALCVIKKKKK